MLPNMGSLVFRVLGAGMLIASIAGAGGCGSTYSDSCKPGKMVSCKCENGAAGSRACSDTDDAACECGGADPTDVGDTGWGSPDGLEPEPDPTEPEPDPTEPEPEVDGGTPSGDGGIDPNIVLEPESAAPNCTKVENRARRVVSTNVMDDAPRALGGSVSPGVYVQTWLIHYRGPKGARPEKIVRSAETLEILADGTGRVTVTENDKPEKHAGIVFKTEGIHVAVEPVCPQGQGQSYDYTATARQLVIYDPPWARVLELQEKAPVVSEEETPVTEGEEGQ